MQVHSAIEYFLLITKPFFDFTNVLSKTRDCTVHYIFSIYNRLFIYLEETEKKLRYKYIHWKKNILRALQLAQKKLSKYYSGTDDSAYSTICALATILYPSKKLQYFDNKNWRDSDIDFIKQYQNREVHQPDILEKIDNIENKKFAMLCDSQQTTLPTDEFDSWQNEIIQYLSKKYKQEFPVLARIAQDILSIPASGAGTEIEITKEYLLSGEAAILDQSCLSSPLLEFIEPISDNEEKEYQEKLQEEDSDNSIDEPAISHLSKRPVNSLDLDNSILLEETAFDSTQTRTGRIRKKPQLPDRFEMGKP
ncbi:hypothetical protein N7450_007206 [Penicillium hetheringtonii]|uniref:HAT C-terminal dimerisation domain-containing protein n=1 Tax=Penicillium hetheringtonii TaxID=911720 RepID=A0AAD6DH01_9EURO|nr:hypothetical protein N7450_007206 [Penicillium hetheringtonii]